MKKIPPKSESSYVCMECDREDHEDEIEDLEDPVCKHCGSTMYPTKIILSVDNVR